MAATVDQAFDFVRLEALSDAEERCRRALDAMERIKAAVVELNELAGPAPLVDETPAQAVPAADPADPVAVTGRLADLLGAQTPPAEVEYDGEALDPVVEPRPDDAIADEDTATAEAAQALAETTAAIGTQLRQDVWSVVYRAGGEGVAPRAVAAALQQYPEPAVRRTLTQLHSSGELQRTGSTKALRYTATPSSPVLADRSTFQDLVLDTVRHHQGQYDRDGVINHVLLLDGPRVSQTAAEQAVENLITAGQISERSDGILQYGPAGS